MAVAGAVPMPSGITTPQDLAVAMRYGPQTEQALRRSSYLTDALRQLTTDGSQNIHSGGELAAKLLAAAILGRKVNQGQDAVMNALRADQGDETARSLSGLTPAAPSGIPSLPTGAAPQPAAPAPVPVQTAQAAPDQGQQAAPQPPVTADASLPRGLRNNNPLNLMGTVPWHNMTGQDPAGYAVFATPQDGLTAADHNLQAYATHHGINTVAGIVNRWAPSTTNGAATGNYIAFVAHQLGIDPTEPLNMADPGVRQQLISAMGHFENGRPLPHFGAGQQVASALGSPAPGSQPIDAPPPPPPAGPVDIGAMGAGANPFPPSAPASSPQAVGAAPAGVSPQAPPAGALPASWPKWRPSQDKIDYVTRLLNDPRHHAEGVALADQYHQKMLEPAEAQITMINGVPFYVPKDPTDGIPSMAIPVPQGAMTHISTAEQLGVPAPHGTTFSVDPLGNPKPLTAPPPGQQVVSPPGQPYAEHYVPGSTNDPTVPQKPSAGYQYNPTGGQGAIPGSQADPRAPMNLVAGTQKIQENLKPTIDLARAGRQSFGTVQAGYQLQNGSGDIAMLKGLNQLINQGVVRPADMDAQMKSDGLAGGIGELTQFINSAGKLTPEIREKVLHAAGAVYQSADQQFKAQVMGHRQTVDAVYGGGSFDKYVMPNEEAAALGWAPAPHGAPPAPHPAAQPQYQAGTREAAIAEARRRGLIH